MITHLFVWWFKFKGWKIAGIVPHEIQKAVVIAAPHTSNWDFIYALAVFKILGLNIKYLAKRELFKFPLSILLKKTGGIPVERAKSQSLTDAIIHKFNHSEKLLVLIPAEGTRKKVEKWKSGFYYVAKGANVPILPGFLDYKNKEAGFGIPIYLSDDKTMDMENLKTFYKTKSAKYPELFNIESIKID